MTSHALDELLELLMDERPDIRLKAFLALAQLSGSGEGALLVGQCRSILSIVVASVATTDINDKTLLLSTTLTTLTNVAASLRGARAVFKHHGLLIKPLLKFITTPSSQYADHASGLLVNLSREPDACTILLQDFDSVVFKGLITSACNTGHNTTGNSLHFVLSAIENMSQLPEGRKLLLDREQNFIQQLRPFTTYSASTARRRAAIAILHNCCFNKDDHKWLLSKDIDIATYLCLPLSGPDNYSDDETNELSEMLVYLPEDKKIEDSLDIRVLLLESLTQLCTTRDGREELRRQNVYYVLRELHKWETESASLLILEDLVNILIRTEEEIGVEDITSVEVTEELTEKFNDMDKQFVEDIDTTPEPPVVSDKE